MKVFPSQDAQTELSPLSLAPKSLMSLLQHTVVPPSIRLGDSGGQGAWVWSVRPSSISVGQGVAQWLSRE